MGRVFGLLHGMRKGETRMERGTLQALRNPEPKREGFYLMREKEVAGSPQPDGRGIQFLYQDDGRMISAARLVGNVTDEDMLGMLATVKGMRALVHSIGVTVETEEREENVLFAFEMYGKDRGFKAAILQMQVKGNGMENILRLEDAVWTENDDIPGQIRFEFGRAGTLARVSVRFYLQDSFHGPKEEEEEAVDRCSPFYEQMIQNSLIQTGSCARLRKAFRRAEAGEKMTVAFIGGSITQGAGAVPIHTRCYAYLTYEGLCRSLGKSTDENIYYCKAGVGGTSSELGLLRYEREVALDGKRLPDIVVVEFAVNDEGDETKGICYESLVRKILGAENEPAVILLFSVFADDWNMQERFLPIGRAYSLPMVSIRNAVTEQFYQAYGSGKAVSKRQFFYDKYHPTNIGHRIMADALLYLLKKAMEAEEGRKGGKDASTGEGSVPEHIIPVIGGEFENVRLIDRKSIPEGVDIDCGAFGETDEKLQMVERDEMLVATKEFPDNWHFDGRKRADLQAGTEDEAPLPFSIQITCRSLFLIYKDFPATEGGSAEVFIDGMHELDVDAAKIGWTHCNAKLCFRSEKACKIRVEIRIKEGTERRQFTILGFGYA